MTLFLHIGFPKTGSTSLQQICLKNSDTLLDKGLSYPVLNPDFKARPLKHLVTKNPATIDHGELERLAKVIDEAATNNPDGHLLFSAEEISSPIMTDLSEASLEKLKGYLSRWSTDVRVIAYVRRPEDFYLSIIQEKLKRSSGIQSANTFRTNFSSIISLYETVFRTKAIVRPFDPSQWTANNLTADFFAQISDVVSITLSDLPISMELSNESLSAEVMLALELCRKLPTSTSAPLRYDRERSERLWRRLRDIAKDVGFTEKPRLFESVARLVRENNKNDTLTLEQKYGVKFGGVPKVSMDAPPKINVFSDVEKIVPIDIERAVQLVSALALKNDITANKKKN